MTVEKPPEQDVNCRIEEWEQYHLRLFFSADIVGSTAFKQKPEGVGGSRPGADPTWFSTVLSFYHQAEKSFNEHWNNYQKAIGSSEDVAHWFGPAPDVWKTVGDEVLFTKRTEHPMQALMAIHAWCQTLSDLRQQLRSKYGLDVKSCVWLADFPLKNQEVVLGHSKPNGEDDFAHLNREALKAFYISDGANKKLLLRDFIGPSIDTGFRLGAFASPRKLIISLELAHLLATEQAHAESNGGWHSRGPSAIKKFSFRYDGKHQLKGVLAGSPYPVFWIDLDPESSIHRTEDELKAAVKPSAHQIKDFTDAMLAEYSSLLGIPMFAESSGRLAPGHKVIGIEVSDAIDARRTLHQAQKKKQENEEVDIASNDDTDTTQKAVRSTADVKSDLTQLQLKQREIQERFFGKPRPSQE